MLRTALVRAALVLGFVLSYPAQVSAKDFVVDWEVAAQEAARQGYCFVIETVDYFAVSSGGNASSQLRGIDGHLSEISAQIVKMGCSQSR